MPALRVSAALALLISLSPPAAGTGRAQEAPPPAEPPPPAAPAPEAPPPEAPAPDNGNVQRRSDEVFPTLDVELPEGDLDLRASRLVGRIFFQGQVKYNFVDGDITAFLRYRVYGHHRTYQVTGFDEVEFGSLERFSDDFERVRGLLFLTEWPHDFHRRTTFLAEIDRIVSNKDELRFDNEKTNTWVRLGYQIGTPDDTRSNAIVGEARARVDRLFTPLRAIGPYGAGLTAAATYGFDFAGGDFEYVKVEAEALKRFDVSERTFVVGRVHGGTFFYKEDRPPEELPEEPQQGDLYTVPISEYFRLDGRENLKGLDERRRGTDEFHTTWEYFFPWFLNASHDFLKLKWQNWYWILYAGAGNVGFDREIYTDLSSYTPDVGVGFESSFGLRKYRFFLSAIVAQALKGEGGVEARISVKSYR